MGREPRWGQDQPEGMGDRSSSVESGMAKLAISVDLEKGEGGDTEED